MSSDHGNKLFQTNNYSIISKYSCVKGGYQRDVVLEEFMESWLKVKSWRRTALINRGYAARMMTVDWIVNRSIRFDGVDCFIILGAGFDFLPFRQQSFESTSRHCTWIELDLPEVISSKSEFIRSRNLLPNDEKLIQVKEGLFSSTSSRYHLVECDLRCCAMLASCLGQLFSSIKVKNVAILNEVCLCYIDLDENRRILSTVIDAVRDFSLRIHYIGYEQYKADEKSPFNAVMSDHFSSMSYPLKHFPNPDQLRRLFLTDLNFNHLTITPIHQIYNTALMEERETFKTAYQEQPFDEYEELCLYLSHYALVTGVLILRDPFIESYAKSDDPKERFADDLGEMSTGDEMSGSVTFVPSELERYGHSSCAIETGSGSCAIFISGGFGRSLEKKNLPHRRLDDCVVVEINSDKNSSDVKLIRTENVDSSSIRLDRMHGQVMSCPGGSNLFFNGGRQSPCKRDALNVAFVGRLIDDNVMEIAHLFNQESTEYTRWRHKLCALNGQDQFIQVGGLSAFKRVDPIVMWNLSADKLGASTMPCEDDDLFRRHSFAMDARDQSTIILMGGLGTSNSMNDRPVDLDSNTILWDTRQERAQIMSYNCATSYGSSVHFVNDYQLVKMGGISTSTGLAENTIQLLDLRNKKRTLLAEYLLPLADQRMILSNTGVCHLKSARQIITTGGGGNYFTFGTRFNRSHLAYRYT